MLAGLPNYRSPGAPTPIGSPSPEVFEPIRCKLTISDCVLDVLVPEIRLQRSGVVTVISQLETTCMAEHVRVSLEPQLGLDPSPLDHPGEARRGEQGTTFLPLRKNVLISDCPYNRDGTAQTFKKGTGKKNGPSTRPGP